MSVQESDVAPDFEMPASGGRTVSKKAMRGKPFVLFFYPKADTPGCTKEACAFQEALPQLGRIGIDVIGVSPDKMKPIEMMSNRWPSRTSLSVFATILSTDSWVKTLPDRSITSMCSLHLRRGDR